MKLGSLKEGGRDGTLVVVSEDLSKAARVSDIVPTMQVALDHWEKIEPMLAGRYQQLNQGNVENSFAADFTKFASPLPL